jgi:hypothetical protein
MKIPYIDVAILQNLKVTNVFKQYKLGTSSLLVDCDTCQCNLTGKT